MRSLNTSSTAFTRSSVFAVMTTPSCPLQLIDAPVPLKSKRCPTSLAVWFSALSTSWWSTLLTTSNDEAAISVPPMSTAILTVALITVRRKAGCPSGQRERSVKPSAQPTLVRTQHPPRPARRYSLVGLAPLAQSAERLHGKEKVYGSIP